MVNDTRAALQTGVIESSWRLISVDCRMRGSGVTLYHAFASRRRVKRAKAGDSGCLRQLRGENTCEKGWVANKTCAFLSLFPLRPLFIVPVKTC